MLTPRPKAFVATLLAEVMVQLFHVFYRIAVDDDTLAFVLA